MHKLLLMINKGMKWGLKLQYKLELNWLVLCLVLLKLEAELMFFFQL